MGFVRFFKRSEPVKTYQSNRVEYVYLNKPVAPNPNPNKFTILKEVVLNNKSILLVHYKGCTTFGGEKLILLKNKWNKTNTLDPHFLSKNHVVLARFEPNIKGWKLAKLCAKNS